MTQPPTTRRILGIDFFTGTLDAALEQSLQGGLTVVPSGPGLATDFVRSPDYRAALLDADLVLTDSGYMVLLWKILTAQKLPRHSGLKFIRALLQSEQLKTPGASFWIMPSPEEAGRNKTWLNANAIPVTEADTYIAPHYGKNTIADEKLLSLIEARKPSVIIIAIGGGVQERLGHFLIKNLSYRPAIYCIGAAIAFVTGGQAAIPPWADRLMLGWLIRILSSPRKFWRRYWEAIRLAPLLRKYRDKLPPMET